MKKHSKQITSGIILFIFGGFVVPGLFLAVMLINLINAKPIAKFAIPGKATFTIDEPGCYYLWNDYETVFEGKTYSSTEKFPGGFEISLVENETGKGIEFTGDRSVRSSIGDDCKKSIGYFKIDKPSSYVLSVSGGSQSRVCSFDKTIFNLKTFLIFLGCFLVTITTGIVGLVLVVLGIINCGKYSKSKQPLQSR